MSLFESGSSKRVNAYIGLGSNLNEPVHQVLRASECIAALQDVHSFERSSLYESSPLGPQNQPDYINAVAEITTTLSPHALLSVLQDIETALGRVRSAERWTARIIDLDIVLFGEKTINSPELVIPHPGLYERAFVLYPLQEIAPHLVIPGYGPLQQLLAQCDNGGLTRLAETMTNTC